MKFYHEHCQNIYVALEYVKKVLKGGGYAYVLIADKRGAIVSVAC